MIVRAIDSVGDWLFGNGKGNYKTANNAIAQSIQTRLSSFLNDCFFDSTAGIDWYNLLGSKNQIALRLALSNSILNTYGVIGIKQLNINYDSTTRNITISYQVQTTFSTINADYQYIANV